MNKKLIPLIGLSVAIGTMITGCSTGGSSQNGKVELELFSNKPESKATLETLIAKFEEENPNIDIKLNNPPDAETVLRTRLAKNEVPDILALGGNATYGELAREGMLMDFSQTDMLETIKPAYIEMIGKLVGPDESAVYGIPYATNANGIIYNKSLFEAKGYEIPKTWDELMELCEKIEADGGTPFYNGYKDAWTAQVAWNALGAGLVEGDFATGKTQGERSFKEDYVEVANKMLQVLEKGNKDPMGTSYGDANIAFSQGQAYMYIQGNWALPEILNLNPDVELGMFPFPSTNDEPALVSGVDVLLTASETTKHPEEVKKFISFMLQEEIAQQYIDEQKAFSAIDGVVQQDSKVVDLAPYIEENKIISYPDHYYLPGLQLQGALQQFFIDKNVDNLLNTLDTDWNNLLEIGNH